jgi:hypothetical protein
MATALRRLWIPAATASMIFLLSFGNTSRAEEPVGKYADDKHDFSITVAEAWKKVPVEDFSVPGEARAAFSRAAGASIVFFVQEPGEAYEPRFLVDASAQALEKNLGATIRDKEVRTIAEKKAMWLVVEGKGTGGAIDGKGSVQTSQLWVAIPREEDIVVALLTSPTSDFAENLKTFEASLETLVVGGKQTKGQSDSK